jgi:uncharacterized membrane protein YedE/YeeE
LQIDWAAFTPVHAVVAGLLIGLAAGLLALGGRQVMAVSGMVGSLLGGAEGRAAWSIAFVAGLFVAPSVLRLWGMLPVLPPATDWGPLVVGGVVLGFGARMGGASLTGQALCGLGRLSPVALGATVCMVAGAALGVGLARSLDHWGTE